MRFEYGRRDASMLACYLACKDTLQSGAERCCHLYCQPDNDLLVRSVSWRACMDIIGLASRKGGAGKTTLAAHIAVEGYHKQVGPVAIMDFDPMGNLASWFNERKLDGPIYAAPDARTGGLQAE